MPSSLIAAVTREKLLADRGTSRIEQHALADFVTRGELDRHLRRMRTRYRVRRDTLVEALGDMLPEATIRGVPAGLHVTVQLPGGDDEQLIRKEANRRDIELETMDDYQPGADSHRPTLLLGYGQMPDQAIRAAVRELATAVRAARRVNATRPRPTAPAHRQSPGEPTRAP